MLILPELQPQNVEQLSGELDEELSLIQQEAQLKLQARAVNVLPADGHCLVPLISSAAL